MQLCFWWEGERKPSCPKIISWTKVGTSTFLEQRGKPRKLTRRVRLDYMALLKRTKRWRVRVAWRAWDPDQWQHSYPRGICHLRFRHLSALSLPRSCPLPLNPPLGLYQYIPTKGESVTFLLTPLVIPPIFFKILFNFNRTNKVFLKIKRSQVKLTGKKNILPFYTSKKLTIIYF